MTTNTTRPTTTAASAGPRSAVHSTFTYDRRYPHAPAAVWHALTDAAAMRGWYFADQDGLTIDELDSRPEVGGGQLVAGRFADGSAFELRATFTDVVPQQRLVAAYDVHIGGAHVSSSISTAELAADGDGTALTFVDQSTHLDGHEDPAQRERGWAGLLDAIGTSLDRG
jgi:uncharacterized protein YndB with AHSA1/START domain